jgi:hypothetical protein
MHVMILEDDVWIADLLRQTFTASARRRKLAAKQA